LQRFGEQGVVELTALIGYFVMVSWLMNVAHTPAQATASGAPLQAFPL
jgi:4-carboxymuconolactone decarboxylase